MAACLQGLGILSFLINSCLFIVMYYSVFVIKKFCLLFFCFLFLVKFYLFKSKQALSYYDANITLLCSSWSYCLCQTWVGWGVGGRSVHSDKVVDCILRWL